MTDGNENNSGFQAISPEPGLIPAPEITDKLPIRILIYGFLLALLLGLGKEYLVRRLTGTMPMGIVPPLAGALTSFFLGSVVFYAGSTVKRFLGRPLTAARSCVAFMSLVAMFGVIMMYGAWAKVFAIDSVNVLLQKKEYDKAITAYAPFIAAGQICAAGKSPAHYDKLCTAVFLGLGDAHSGKGSFDTALQYFTLGIKMNPEAKAAYRAYINRGNIYLRHKNLDKAIQDFSMAIQIEPSFGLAYHNRGNSYLMAGDKDAAIADFSKAIALDPMSFWIYERRAEAYALKMEYGRAGADYAAAIKAISALSGKKGSNANVLARLAALEAKKTSMLALAASKE